MLQLQLFDTYSDLFSSMEQQLHRGKIPLMLFKNITKKKDVRERIFWTTRATFVTKLRANIVLASSTIVVCIHPQNHPHFAYRNSLQQIYAPIYFFFFCFTGVGGMRLCIILFNVLIPLLALPG
jgi:hypothetical protein